MLDKEKIRILRLPIKKFIRDNIHVYVKFELNSNNGYFVAGNNWTNTLYDLYFPITLEQLISEGWSHATN